MQAYPYRPVAVEWKRPPITREILKRCTERSDLKGTLHGVGILVILSATGTWAYLMFATQHWVWMAVALYIHGGLWAFNPETHELSHGTMFKRRWLNSFFKRVFGLVHWTSNGALYKMSHWYHHRYTLHRQSEGEEVHPRAEPAETILQRAVNVVNPMGLVTAVYDRIYALFVPFLCNTRRGTWLRYAYAQADRTAQRDAYWTELSQFLFHLLFALFAIASGKWFLIVVVTLPPFYGGKWYHTLVHDTMHVAREPETDTFQACCRTVRLDPFTSYLYWHMEWHVEHHAFPGVPCYNLKTFHELTREHWDRPQTLIEAWKEMDAHSKKLLRIPE
ncbi:MAG: hypothetical protein HN919_01285 [Verrucomicrobia bacterium]|jgi:fatty acid desaturase|nr:hypothetical protein [Verrucomicrobiota bacterium]MBT7064910.1 hypothetical protein [Verrucomicrobiota bacterium]MBT7699963.1 hypothetical protein [Verrucomicrobiota bacterium]